LGRGVRGRGGGGGSTEGFSAHLLVLVHLEPSGVRFRGLRHGEASRLGAAAARRIASCILFIRFISCVAFRIHVRMVWPGNGQAWNSLPSSYCSWIACLCSAKCFLRPRRLPTYPPPVRTLRSVARPTYLPTRKSGGRHQLRLVCLTTSACSKFLFPTGSGAGFSCSADVAELAGARGCR
jgi:hypothetical protein